MQKINEEILGKINELTIILDTQIKVINNDKEELFSSYKLDEILDYCEKYYCGQKIIYIVLDDISEYPEVIEESVTKEEFIDNIECHLDLEGACEEVDFILNRCACSKKLLLDEIDYYEQVAIKYAFEKFNVDLIDWKDKAYKIAKSCINNGVGDWSTQDIKDKLEKELMFEPDEVNYAIINIKIDLKNVIESIVIENKVKGYSRKKALQLMIDDAEISTIAKEVIKDIWEE